MGIRLTKYQLRAWVDDDMELFEVFHYSMEILEVKTAAGVIAALLENSDRSVSNEKRDLR